MTRASHTPAVSVLMTCHNRETFIAEAIESVLDSTFSDFELIIVDDASTDRSVEVARRYESDPRVRVHVNPVNLGDYPNRNRAAELARGRYLKYVDADDTIAPRGLQIMVEAMERFPEAALGLSSRAIPGLEYPARITPEEAYRLHFLGGGDFFDRSPLSAILRADAFRDSEKFKSAPLIGDQELWLRLSASLPIVLLPVDLGWYRIHEGQQSAYERARAHEMARIRFGVTMDALLSESCPLSPRDREHALRRVRREHARRIYASARDGQWRGARAMMDFTRLAPADLIRALIPAAWWKAERI